MADSEAGRVVDCPECRQKFQAPQLVVPLSPEAQPALEKTSFPVPSSEPLPGVESPPELTPPRLPDLPPPDRELSGYSQMVSIALDPKVLAMIPAAALFIALVLTLFSWNGMYPAGYAAYTQNAWQALYAGLSHDDVAEDELKLRAKLESYLRSCWWLLPYLFLLPITAALAAAGAAHTFGVLKPPPPLEAVWQFRPLVQGILGVLLLFALLIQWASGFGLQRAVPRMEEDEFQEQRREANTPEKIQRLEMKIAAKVGAHHVRSTAAVRISALVHVLALVAVALETWIALRGPARYAPRLALMW